MVYEVGFLCIVYVRVGLTWRDLGVCSVISTPGILRLPCWPNAIFNQLLT
jgi:hypothetical protein